MLIPLTLAALASIADPAAAPTPAPAAPAPQSAESRKTYCLTGDLTGSRIPRRECHTRTEWLKQGIDPLKLIKS